MTFGLPSSLAWNSLIKYLLTFTCDENWNLTDRGHKRNKKNDTENPTWEHACRKTLIWKLLVWTRIIKVNADSAMTCRHSLGSDFQFRKETQKKLLSFLSLLHAKNSTCVAATSSATSSATTLSWSTWPPADGLQLLTYKKLISLKISPVAYNSQKRSIKTMW